MLFYSFVSARALTPTVPVPHRHSFPKINKFKPSAGHSIKHLLTYPKKDVNFLSHYYFTQDEPNPYYTLGSLLPDLFRNHRANWKFNPEKQPELFAGDDNLEHLLRGWNLHLEVDHLFHDAALFKQESSILRKDLVGVFHQLPKRPFFLAHIGYELLLDSLLIRHRLVDTHKFYATLAACQTEVIERFLNKLGMYHNERFYNFLDDFISSRYRER